jgi:hypothetical protein
MSTPTGNEFDDVIDPDPQGVLPRDRSQHGKAGRIDDDVLARITEQERIDAGIDDYDPETVPPATDVATDVDITQTEQYQEELTEARRVAREGGSATST